jgi:hypothetical protein
MGTHHHGDGIASREDGMQKKIVANNFMPWISSSAE